MRGNQFVNRKLHGSSFTKKTLPTSCKFYTHFCITPRNWKLEGKLKKVVWSSHKISSFNFLWNGKMTLLSKEVSQINHHNQSEEYLMWRAETVVRKCYIKRMFVLFPFSLQVSKLKTPSILSSKVFEGWRYAKRFKAMNCVGPKRRFLIQRK